MNAEKPPSFYRDAVFTTATQDFNTITERAISAISETLETPVVGGNKKQAGLLTINPSQTPSGKLNNVPLGSLHLADAETVDGVSVPVTKDELFREDVLNRLTAYTPNRVISELAELCVKLP